MLITSPDAPELKELAARLASQSPRLDLEGCWPGEQLELLGRSGVYRWFLPRAWGGQEWDAADIVRGYLKLSEACLTTAFILTQRTGACRRIVAGDNARLRERLLPDLASGACFATVAISHLTTSRRHLDRPILTAREEGDELVLDGYCAWVTGARHAQVVVTGATLEDGRQVLVALPMDLPGIEAAEPLRLVALTASHTGELRLRSVRVGREWLLAGPVENVMAQGAGGRTGGLETSALAVGLSAAAILYLEREAERRGNLLGAAAGLRHEHGRLEDDLLRAAAGEPGCTTDEIRARANSLALRSAQAALAAAKGTGFVAGHPAGRWCREALFFLVWSCPQPVLAANLCELAGLE